MKKKYISWMLLMLLVSVFSCKTTQTENSDANKTNGNETSTEENQTVKVKFTPQTYEVPQPVNYFPMEGAYLINSFRPLGWSDNGLFAYVIEPADEACGCYFFEIYIQNLKNDKIEWSYKFEKEISETDYNIDSVWAAHDSAFTAKLNEYKIISNKRFHLRNGQLNNKGKNYFFNFSKETKFDDDYQIDWVTASKLELKEENEETPLFSFKETAYEYVLNTGLSGFLHSPYEDRVAFIIWQARWGYEGTPYVVNYKVIGAELP